MERHTQTSPPLGDGSGTHDDTTSAGPLAGLIFAVLVLVVVRVCREGSFHETA